MTGRHSSRHTRRAVLRGAVVFAGSAAAAVFGGCETTLFPPAAPTKVARIGFLLTIPISDPIAVANVGAFREGLRELGYVEGEDLVLELRSTDGKPERLPERVAELVALHPDVLLNASLPGTTALKEATNTIPIVFIGLNPASVGISEPAHPGGNITGIGATSEAGVNAKRLQLLKEAVPSVMRVAVIWNPTPSPAALTQLSEMQEAVPVLGVQIQIVEVRTIDAFARALPAALSGHADALLVQERVLALPRAAEIASFALQNRLPSMYRGREFVEAGGLMSYAANSTVGWRRAASFVDRILKGAYPGDLPVEGSPIVQELAINLCTAGRLGITIPASVLTQADVIQCRSR